MSSAGMPGRAPRPHSFASEAASGSSLEDEEPQMDTQDLAGKDFASNIVGEGPIKIDVHDNIRSVIFFSGGKELLSAGGRGKIRRWRVADGEEVGRPMDAGTAIGDAAISPDGRWIVAGTLNGQVIVWDAETHQISSKFEHTQNRAVNVVDVSVDSTRIASGSDDRTVVVWSLAGNQQLRLLLDSFVTALKFSPNGQYIATATYYRESVQVCDVHTGQLVADFPIYVCTTLNGSLAWKSDSKQLFTLSSAGDVHCLDIPTKTTQLRWNIDDDEDTANYIALSCDDRLIATSGNSSFTLWDTSAHEKLGSDKHSFSSNAPMAISSSYDIAVASDKKIILQHLPPILPKDYFAKLSEPAVDDVILDLKAEVKSLRAENANKETDIQKLGDAILKARDVSDQERNKVEKLEEQKESLEQVINNLHDNLAESKGEKAELEKSLRKQKDLSDQTVEEIRRELDGSNGEKSKLEETAQSLRKQIDRSEQSIQQLRGDLANLRDKLEKAKSSLREEKDRSEQNERALSDNLEKSHQEMSMLKERIRSEKQSSELATQELHDELTRSKKEKDRLEKEFRLQKESLEQITQKHREELAKSSGEIARLEEEIRSQSSASAQTTQQLQNELARSKGEKDELNEKVRSQKDSFEKITQKLRDELAMSIETTKRMEESIRSQKESTEQDAQRQREEFQRKKDVLEEIIRSQKESLGNKPEAAKALASLEQTVRGLNDQLAQSRAEKDELAATVQSQKENSENIERTVQGLRNELALSNEEKTRLVEAVQSQKENSEHATQKLYEQLAESNSESDRLREIIKSEKESTERTIRGLNNELSKAKKEQDSLEEKSRAQKKDSDEASRLLTEERDQLKAEVDALRTNPKNPLDESVQTETVLPDSATLQPGFDGAREKLCLASERQMTHEEDINWLFSIFSVTRSTTYGEGKQAISHLLGHILTHSDNVTILSWTGTAHSQYSYLPADLTVYDQVEPRHVPQPVAEMDNEVKSLPSPLRDHSLATSLYNRLRDLAAPMFVSNQLRLSGLVFPIVERPSPKSSGGVYHFRSPVLGDVDIETTDNLSAMKGLRLIHPWINSLLDQDFSTTEVSQADLVWRALRMVVRLRQRFGALLLARVSRAQYRCVATDCLIMVQVHNEVGLGELMASVQAVDVH